MFKRLRQGIARTRESVLGGLRAIAPGGRSTTLDAEAADQLEMTLVMADTGMAAAEAISGGVRERLRRGEEGGEVIAAVRNEIAAQLAPVEAPLVIPPSLGRPFVILVVGVNGVGKTTTIAKLARYLQNQGHRVMLAAGDTFRAAAVEQLKAWGERLDLPVIAQGTGADAASVLFDAYTAAASRQADVLIADTAGRLHNKGGLMDELQKIFRVLRKHGEALPDEALLVLDATMGQNALVQAAAFHEAVALDSIVLTKLDGTAKGGILLALARQLQLPIRFIGVGEQFDDLQPFDAQEFASALVAESDLDGVDESK